MSALTDEQLAHFKELLLNIEAELKATLESTTEDTETVTLDQSRVGRLSRIDALQQQAMAQAEHQQFIKRLKDITIALRKIKNDDFGWCQECDELISLERLTIKPESQFCINCQEKKERTE